MQPLKTMGMHILACLLLLTHFSSALAQDASPLVCGIADGYPPYQFREDGKSVGLDAEWMELIARKLGRKLVLQHGNWDDIVSLLRFHRIDCIVGMEINATRSKYFAFTSPYYHRESVIFARADDKTVNRIEDLVNNIVAGDRHSPTEAYFEAHLDEIRIFETETKEKSIILLKLKRVEAAIVPAEVGHYLTKKHHLRTKIIYRHATKMPVSIAVNKKDQELLRSIQSTADALEKEGAFKKLARKWLVDP